MKMAQEDPTWRHTRLRGALYDLGHEGARNTIKNVLLAHGLEPAPERGRHTSWHTFIKSHLGAIAGADFFTVEVLRGFGLVRYYVFFVIDIGTRRVPPARPPTSPTCLPTTLEDEEKHDRDLPHFCHNRQLLLFANCPIILRRRTRVAITARRCDGSRRRR
jgi:hypothetical protein